MKHLLLSVLLVSFGLPAGAQTLSDVQKSYDAGDYRGALQSIAQAMSIKQSPLPPDKEYSMLMLKGEALLHIGERWYAISAFDAASRAAAEQKHFHDAAIARANAVLIERSQGANYKPAGDGDTINIVSPKTRPAAMKAAYGDLFDQYKHQFEAVLEGSTLPPMLDLVPTLGDLYVLETAAEGKPAKTTEILKSFGLHARALMVKELTRENQRINQLSALANSLEGSDWSTGTIDRRGLWTPERRELRDIMDYVQRIQKAALRGRRIAKSFGFTGENWDGVIAGAGDVLDKAQELWEHRY